MFFLELALRDMILPIQDLKAASWYGVLIGGTAQFSGENVLLSKSSKSCRHVEGRYPCISIPKRSASRPLIIYHPNRKRYMRILLF